MICRHLSLWSPMTVAPIPWKNKTLWKWLRFVSNRKLCLHSLPVCLQHLRWSCVLINSKNTMSQCRLVHNSMTSVPLLMSEFSEEALLDWLGRVFLRKDTYKCGLWNQMRCASQVCSKDSWWGGGWLFVSLCKCTRVQAFLFDLLRISQFQLAPFWEVEDDIVKQLLSHLTQ